MSPIYTFKCTKCGKKRDIICSVHGEFIEKDNVCVCGKTEWRRLKGVTAPGKIEVVGGTPKYHE